MNIMKKNKIAAVIFTGLLVQVVNPCLNTIKNNTPHTYKIAEIKQDNLFLKNVIDLPDDYLEDEQKAHTLKPTESVSFGGHYLPTFAVFKDYDGIWENILVVKQRECGPRGKEEKTLLLTDVLKGELPGDFQPSYKFTFKKNPATIAETSINQKMLSSNKNYYQLVSESCAKHEQELQEILSKILHKEKQVEEVCPAATAILNKDDNDAEKTTQQGKQENAPASTTAAQNAPTTATASATTTPKQETTAAPKAAAAPTAVEEDADDDGKKCAACAA